MRGFGARGAAAPEHAMRDRNRCGPSLVLMLLAVLMSPAVLAKDAFVRVLAPCLDYIQNEATDRYPQIIFDQGWVALLFPLEDATSEPGLGTDLCGELGNGGLSFGGSYRWPSALGVESAGSGHGGVDRAKITADWLERVVQAARTQAQTGAPIRRVTLTRLPEGEHIRVFFAVAEQQAEAPASVDLDSRLRVTARVHELPDELARHDSDAPAADPASTVASSGAASLVPTVDPVAALEQLKQHMQSGPVSVLRVAFASFSAHIDYRAQSAGARQQVRTTSFDHINGQAGNPKDAASEFPKAFKPCSMRMSQVEHAVRDIAKQPRVRALAPRLHHLILECSEHEAKPYWMVIALEPFEHLNLPAQLEP